MSFCQYRCALQNFHVQTSMLMYGVFGTFLFGVFQYLKSPFKEVVPGIAANINIYLSFIPVLLIQLFILAASEMTLCSRSWWSWTGFFCSLVWALCSEAGQPLQVELQVCTVHPQGCDKGDWSVRGGCLVLLLCNKSTLAWEGRGTSQCRESVQHIAGKPSLEFARCCTNEEFPACGGMEDFSLSTILLVLI